jgi:hypothetical protein
MRKSAVALMVLLLVLSLSSVVFARQDSWTAIPYSALNFYGGGGVQWTPGQPSIFQYRIDGDTARVQIDTAEGYVSGDTLQLMIQLPAVVPRPIATMQKGVCAVDWDGHHIWGIYEIYNSGAIAVWAPYAYFGNNRWPGGSVVGVHLDIGYRIE